jgi:hypothetical protein
MNGWILMNFYNVFIVKSDLLGNRILMIVILVPDHGSRDRDVVLVKAHN